MAGHPGGFTTCRRGWGCHHACLQEVQGPFRRQHNNTLLQRHQQHPPTPPHAPLSQLSLHHHHRSTLPHHHHTLPHQQQLSTLLFSQRPLTPGVSRPTHRLGWRRLQPQQLLEQRTQLHRESTWCTPPRSPWRRAVHSCLDTMGLPSPRPRAGVQNRCAGNLVPLRRKPARVWMC